MKLTYYLPSTQTPENVMHDTTIFEDPDFMEVFRVLDVEIRVTKIEPDQDQPERPRIHFVGTFGGQQTMAGIVMATAEGHVRWKFVSLFAYKMYSFWVVGGLTELLW